MIPMSETPHPRAAPGAPADRDDATAAAQAIALRTGDRPYSLASGLASGLRRGLPGRCTANPDCVAAGRCAATPSMQRACAAAFQTWARRTMVPDTPGDRFDEAG